MSEPFDITEYAKCPPYMIDAWAGCLSWAISEPEILDRFMADSGVRVKRDALSRMIDAATGHDRDIVVKFLNWFNENIWGEA